MSEQKESSVLFSLKELMSLEEDRIKQEDDAKAAAIAAEAQAKADAERRAREEEEARIQAEENRRLNEERRAREEAEATSHIQDALAGEGSCHLEDRIHLGPSQRGCLGVLVIFAADVVILCGWLRHGRLLMLLRPTNVTVISSLFPTG